MRREGRGVTVTHEERFAVALPRDEVWEVMSDTQHLNELFFGLSQATLVSRDRDKARLKGTFGVLAPEYDELPWVFEVPHRYESVRLFTKGVLGSLRTSCVLDEEGPSTTVRYTVTVDGRGPVGGIASHYVAYRTRRGLARVRALLDGRAQGRALQQQMQWPPANPYREATIMRATPLCEAMQHELTPAQRPIVTQLLQHLA